MHGGLGYPTDDRPIFYQRPFSTDSASATEWLTENRSLIGDAVSNGTPEWATAARLLFTWRDLLVEDVRDMPITSFIEHRIPTYPRSVPRISKLPLYTPKEIQWMEDNIPKIEQAGIIERCQSPWSAKTKFPVKQDGVSLRMVHQFIAINAATVKMNYPMRRIEPILNRLSQQR